MIWMLLLLALGALLYGVYRVRAAWSPFTSHGRRRVIYWGRSWWAGDQAENRDEY